LVSTLILSWCTLGGIHAHTSTTVRATPFHHSNIQMEVDPEAQVLTHLGLKQEYTRAHWEEFRGLRSRGQAQQYGAEKRGVGLPRCHETSAIVIHENPRETYIAVSTENGAPNVLTSGNGPQILGLNTSAEAVTNQLNTSNEEVRPQGTSPAGQQRVPDRAIRMETETAGPSERQEMGSGSAVTLRSASTAEQPAKRGRGKGTM
jgi:hypothetical protein